MADLERCAAWLERRRASVLAGAALTTVVCLAGAARLGLERDVLALLPREDPTVADYVDALAHLRRLDQIMIDVSTPGEPFSPRTTSVADAIASHLDRSDRLRSVTRRMELEDLLSIHSTLRSSRASLFSPAVADATARLLRHRAVEERLDRIRRSMAELPDPVAVEMFRADPIGLDGPLLGLLPPPPGVAGTGRVVDGRLWSRDGEHLLLLAEPATTELGGDNATAVTAAVEEALRRARAEHGGATRAAHLSRYRAAAENERIVRADVARSLWVSLVGIGCLLGVAFRRWGLIPLLFMPPLFGGIVAVAALASVYGRVSPLVVGCGSILLGISIDYAIHLVMRLLRAHPHEATARAQAVGETARPLLVAAGTTAGAFLTLLLSSLPGHRQLGVFAATGVLAAAAFTLGALHLVAPRGTPAGGRGCDILGRLTGGIPGRIWAVALALVVTAVSLPGLRLLRIDSDLDRFNALGEAARSDFDAIQATWGSPLGQTSLVVRGPTLDHALRRAGALALVLSEERAEGRVEDFSSVTALLPDRATQEQNRRRWASFWSPERIAAIRATTERAMAERGFEPRAVAASWTALEAQGRPLEPSEVLNGPLGLLLEDWIAGGGEGETWVVTRCAFAPQVDFEEQARRLRRAVPGLMVADGQAAMRRLSAVVYRELTRMSVLAFVVVVAVLLPASRGWRTPVVVVVTLVTTFLWSLGVLGLAGIPLSMMNCMLAIFVFGLTVDYAVFLIHARALDPASRGATASAVALSSLTTLIGFGALLLADHPSLVAIGATTVIGVACGLVAAFTLVAALGPARGEGGPRPPGFGGPPP